MRVSSRGEYGVRAMFDLAQRHGRGPIPLKSISERQDISEHYLEQLMSALRKAGLVTSVRGAQGGYKLTDDPRDVTLGDVIRALEGPVLTVYGTEDDPGHKSNVMSPEQMVLTDVWKQLAEKVNAVLDEVSLADLTVRAAQIKADDDSFMYHI